MRNSLQNIGQDVSNGCINFYGYLFNYIARGVICWSKDNLVSAHTVHISARQIAYQPLS